jgi:hypothetical protein
MGRFDDIRLINHSSLLFFVFFFSSIAALASVEIHGLPALIAALRPAEKLMPAGRADISKLLLGHPLLYPVIPPIGDRTKDNFLSHRHWKIFNMCAGKLSTLVTAGNVLFPCAFLYRTNPTEKRDLIGQAAPALEVLNGQVIDSGNRGLVEMEKFFEKFGVVVPGGVIDAADPAVESAGSKKGFINHYFPPSKQLSDKLSGLVGPPWQESLGLLPHFVLLENGETILTLNFTLRHTKDICKKLFFTGA